VSTRNGQSLRIVAGRLLSAGRVDPVEEVAIVAHARRELLLRAHGFRLRREDLEDCYSQATLELMLRARHGRFFAGQRHLANAIEQRFLSRIHDRRRALAGRSPIQAALEGARPLSDPTLEEAGVVDLRAEIERLVMLRHELQRIPPLAQRLSFDQRLVLASQIAQVPAGEFCTRYGWSAEKYRKVAQRARARLRHLMSLDDAAVPSPRQASDQGPGPAYDQTPNS
jgi:hypothetical protein